MKPQSRPFREVHSIEAIQGGSLDRGRSGRFTWSRPFREVHLVEAVQGGSPEESRWE